MADDYITYSTKYDLQPTKDREEPGQLCVYNTDCHPDSSCVDNKCVMAMKLPAVMPFQVQPPIVKTLVGNNSLNNGQGCLSRNDCQSNYCNRFTCMNPPPAYVVYPSSSNNRVPLRNIPMTRCITDKDCNGNTKCNSNYQCQ